jgi:diguanylate cyclase (GGDEF)-like protein/PAS domain S-box-containing protein
MSMKLKIFIAIIVIFSLASLGIYYFSDAILLGNIKTQEREAIYQNVVRVEKILKKDLNSINSTCLDWSAWDDTYYFVENKNKNYIETNLSDSSFSNLNVDVMIISDLYGNVIYSKTLDNNEELSADITESLKSITDKSRSLVRNNNISNHISGLTFINDKPLLVVSNAITNSDKLAVPNGFLIMGRYIGPNEINELEDLTDCNIEISKIKDMGLSIVKKDLQIKDNKFNFSTIVIDDNTIEGIGVFKDMEGKNSFLVTLRSDRNMYNQGYKNFKSFTLAFILFMAIITILSISIAQKVFLSRLQKLSDFMNRVSGNKDLRLRAEVDGNDEISNLAKVTNSMLEKIDFTNSKLMKNEKRLAQVIEGSNDGFWDIDIPSKKIYLSPKIFEFLGYSYDEEIDCLEFIKTLFPQDELDSINNLMNNLHSDLDNISREHKLHTKSGEIKWFLAKGKVVERDNEGNPIRLAGIAADITERKKSEEEIEYLSYHDFLTGLYNRPYLFKELERLNKEKKFPLGIIMGDVNGLKLTNDAFGHNAGDKLLIEMANILKMSCNEDELVARLGGDEFIVVLPESNEEKILELRKRINYNCQISQLRPVKPNISLGGIIQNEPVDDIQELFEVAEDRMYKRKLLESKSVRHSIIALMEHSLLETDFETRAHTERLYNLSLKMGKKLKLPNSIIDELSLLSKLHDIGKIAIPREILLKPASLNEDEWEIIKTHTEIGYRMALSTQDLLPIAEAILCHHERWDGSGYPRGLKDVEIPLISRIIAIIDAYDVITHARPYKEASSHEEALNEISRCSSTHFDPHLVEVFKSMFE